MACGGFNIGHFFHLSAINSYYINFCLQRSANLHDSGGMVYKFSLPAERRIAGYSTLQDDVSFIPPTRGRSDASMHILLCEFATLPLDVQNILCEEVRRLLSLSSSEVTAFANQLDAASAAPLVRDLTLPVCWIDLRPPEPARRFLYP